MPGSLVSCRAHRRNACHRAPCGCVVIPGAFSSLVPSAAAAPVCRASRTRARLIRHEPFRLARRAVRLPCCVSGPKHSLTEDGRRLVAVRSACGKANARRCVLRGEVPTACQILAALPQESPGSLIVAHDGVGCPRRGSRATRASRLSVGTKMVATVCLRRGRRRARSMGVLSMAVARQRLVPPQSGPGLARLQRRPRFT